MAHATAQLQNPEFYPLPNSGEPAAFYPDELVEEIDTQPSAQDVFYPNDCLMYSSQASYEHFGYMQGPIMYPTTYWPMVYPTVPALTYPSLPSEICRSACYDPYGDSPIASHYGSPRALSTISTPARMRTHSNFAENEVLNNVSGANSFGMQQH
eukprot:GEMP01103178.1.p1 GENE.GEMP01103178.1~~GEMP01103178.1.p1  ORF type:complete len:178 (+),score=17.04 GEMP01103178.1:74-535(+)